MKTRNLLNAREVEDLEQRLMRRLGDSSVPTLPHVAVKIIELMGNPSAGMHDFGRVIASDQGLTGRILRLANSAYFAQRGGVSRIDRAMVLIGLDRIKAIALGFHLGQTAAGRGCSQQERRLWSLAIFRGWLALRIAERLDKRVSGEAFVVGMMLDAGVPMMVQLAGDAHARVIQGCVLPAEQFRAEHEGLEFTHADVVGALCRMWKLPEIIAKPIAQHHTPVLGTVNPKDPSSVLRGISFFTGMLPLGENTLSGPPAELVPVAQRLFGMDRAALEAALKNAAGDYDAIIEMFDAIADNSLTAERILERANHHLADAVEELVKESASAEARTLRFTATARPAVRGKEASFTCFEIRAAPNHAVHVVVLDSDGNGVITEEISPAQHSAGELRRLLPLDGMAEADIAGLLASIRSMAA